MSDLTVQPKRRSRFLIVAGVLGATLLAGGAVYAQYGGGYGYGPRGGYHDHGDSRPGWRGDGPRMGGPARFQRYCMMDTRRWHGLARMAVKANLRLSNDQAAEFDKLADGLMPQLEQLKTDACNNFAAASDSAPEKLKKMAEMARKIADVADKNTEAFGKFYATLDAGQKARVDLAFSRHRGMMDRGGMGPGGMHPGMGRMGPGSDRMGPPGGPGPGYYGPRGPGDFRGGQPGYGGGYAPRNDDGQGYPGGPYRRWN